MAILTGKQRRYLRGLGHKLEPVVLVGKDGVTEGLCEAIDAALGDHELIKVKIGQNAGVERREAAAEMAERTKSALVQVLGSTVLLYRPHPEEPKIELPKGRRGGQKSAAKSVDTGPDVDDDDEGDADEA